MQKSFKMISRPWLFIAALGFFVLLPPQQAKAHCDGMDGPVVKAAQTALDTENINPVLIWVPKESVAEIQDVFKKSLAVRKLGSPEAKEVADNYFFETIVRVHRTGEGAPYTGLKPAGRDLGPAIPAADKAIEEGSLKQVSALLTETVQKGLEEHFTAVMNQKNFKADDIAAGREYVESYVAYIHYVERLYEAAHGPAQGHYHDPGAE